MSLSHRLGRAVCAGALCVLALGPVAAVAAAAASEPQCPPTAEAPSQEQLRAGMQAATNHGFLWRLRRDGHTSYLFGTLHVARFEWMFPGAALMQALHSVDTVALELDLLDPDVQRRLQEGLRAGGAPLPPPLQQRLAAQQRAACVPLAAMAGLSPELQVDTLTTLAGRRDGLDPAFGIDNFLAGWAHAANKSVVSLETPELQMRTLRMASVSETLAFVDASLQELESGLARSTLLRLATAWADSDLATLSAYATWCGCMDTASDRAEMARLVDDRNPAMADSIAALHGRGQSVLAAVGSLHMIGPRGVPELLARQGFVVERLAP